MKNNILSVSIFSILLAQGVMSLGLCIASEAGQSEDSSRARVKRGVMLGTKNGGEQSCLWTPGARIRVSFLPNSSDSALDQELNRALDQELKHDIEAYLAQWNENGSYLLEKVKENEPAEIRITFANVLISISDIGKCASPDPHAPTMILSRPEMMDPAVRKARLLKLLGQSLGFLPESFHPCAGAKSCRKADFKAWKSEMVLAAHEKWAPKIVEAAKQIESCALVKSHPLRLAPKYSPKPINPDPFAAIAWENHVNFLNRAHAAILEAQKRLKLDRIQDAAGTGVEPTLEINPETVDSAKGYHLYCDENKMTLSVIQPENPEKYYESLVLAAIGFTGADVCNGDLLCQDALSVRTEHLPQGLTYKDVTFNQLDANSAMNESGQVSVNDHSLAWSVYAQPVKFEQIGDAGPGASGAPHPGIMTAAIILCLIRAVY